MGLRFQDDGAGEVDVELELQAAASRWTVRTLDAATGAEVSSAETAWSAVLDQATHAAE